MKRAENHKDQGTLARARMNLASAALNKARIAMPRWFSSSRGSNEPAAIKDVEGAAEARQERLGLSHYHPPR